MQDGGERSPGTGTGVMLALVTVPLDGDDGKTSKTGEEISKALVGEELVACVNHIGPIRSVFRWEGKVEAEGEELLVIKLPAAGFERMRARVQQLHPYDVPEVLGFEVDRGHEAYLAWVFDETKG